MEETEEISPYRRVLLMVEALHELGYEQLRVRSYVSGMGTWRCGVFPAIYLPGHPADLSEDVFTSGVSVEDCQYTSATEMQPFGWRDAENDSPEQLALKFIERVKPFALLGRGPDPDYAAWFRYMLAVTAPNGVISAWANNEVAVIDGAICDVDSGKWDHLRGEQCKTRRIGLPPSFDPDLITANTVADGAPLPFASYPGGGKMLLGRVKGSNCRRGYGLQFMKKTKQTCCAYCGLDFNASYENWLQMALDHVVPAAAGKAHGILDEWLDDSASKVLACASCNGFQNRYSIAKDEPKPATVEEFFALRDRIFKARWLAVEDSHRKEREFFIRNFAPE